MRYLGKHCNRETYYLGINDYYQDKLPTSNWVCFAIANSKPDDNILSQFIRNSIEKDLFEFKGCGLFAEYLHDVFDEEIVALEVIENHPEIEIMTTGSNDTDISSAFWESFGATCLPDRADYDNIKVICVSFDNKDYSSKLESLIKRFNRNWLPKSDEEILKNNNMEITLSKSESIVLFEFLARINMENIKDIFEDQAEERILWDLESALESKLSEIFQDNYSEILSKARKEIRDDITN